MSPGNGFRRLLPVLLACWLSGHQASAQAADPALVLPFPARLEPVIEDGEIEGRRVRVARFSTALNREELVLALRRDWRGAQGAELLETRLPGWRVLSSWSVDGFRTLQFRPAASGGTEGVLSVWPSDVGGLGAGAAAAGPALPGSELLPEGSVVLRRFSAVDGGRRGQTLVAVSEAAPAWLAEAIAQRLSMRGYRADPVLHAGGGRGEARRFRRGDSEVVFTVSPAGAGGSGVVLHAIGVAP